MFAIIFNHNNVVYTEWWEIDKKLFEDLQSMRIWWQLFALL